jgi:hypothetical protein
MNEKLDFAEMCIVYRNLANMSCGNASSSQGKKTKKSNYYDESKRQQNCEVRS